MNLNTIEEIWRARPDNLLPTEWRDGDSWLAGGTWLFSEPQPTLRRLLDLQGFGWESLTASPAGLSIAATCTIEELNAFQAPTDWIAAPLFQQCCNAFLASFKIWHTATVGGNICMSLPAGPMITLTAALEGVCTITSRSGETRQVAVVDFVTGDHANLLQPGDLLRSIELPRSALQKQTALHRMSLTHLGRSSVFLIGTRDPQSGAIAITVTAATVRPFRIEFAQLPDAAELAATLDSRIADDHYHNDVHGKPAYRKHLTYQFAEEIRQELASFL